MKTELSFDLMEKILPDISEIVSDEAITDIKDEHRKNKTLKAGSAMQMLMPAFITRHRDATLHMVACLSGKTVDEVKEQPLDETVTVLANGFTDEMLSFFGLCLRIALRS